MSSNLPPLTPPPPPPPPPPLRGHSSEYYNRSLGPHLVSSALSMLRTSFRELDFLDSSLAPPTATPTTHQSIIHHIIRLSISKCMNDSIVTGLCINTLHVVCLTPRAESCKCLAPSPVPLSWFGSCPSQSTGPCAFCPSLTQPPPVAS